MKKIFAFISVVLVVLSLVFSLSSCQSAEDIEGARKTESNLKTNYYETTLVDGKEQLAALGAADYLKSLVTAKKDSESIIICYCKNVGAANEVLEVFEQMAEESDAELLYERSGNTVFLGTKDALKCSVKKVWTNQLKQTFIEQNRYMYIVKGLGNTLIITLGALFIGVILGGLIAVAKY